MIKIKYKFYDKPSQNIIIIESKYCNNNNKTLTWKIIVKNLTASSEAIFIKVKDLDISNS